MRLFMRRDSGTQDAALPRNPSAELLQCRIRLLSRFVDAAQTARRRNGYRCAKRQGKPNFTNPHLSLQHGHFRDFAFATRRARLHPVHREP
jgi:hypothetical protein